MSAEDEPALSASTSASASSALASASSSHHVVLGQSTTATPARPSRVSASPFPPHTAAFSAPSFAQSASALALSSASPLSASSPSPTSSPAASVAPPPPAALSSFSAHSDFHALASHIRLNYAQYVRTKRRFLGHSPDRQHEKLGRTPHDVRPAGSDASCPFVAPPAAASLPASFWLVLLVGALCLAWTVRHRLTQHTVSARHTPSSIPLSSPPSCRANSLCCPRRCVRCVLRSVTCRCV